MSVDALGCRLLVEFTQHNKSDSFEIVSNCCLSFMRVGLGCTLVDSVGNTRIKMANWAAAFFALTVFLPVTLLGILLHTISVSHKDEYDRIQHLMRTNLERPGSLPASVVPPSATVPEPAIGDFMIRNPSYPVNDFLRDVGEERFKTLCECLSKNDQARGWVAKVIKDPLFHELHEKLQSEIVRIVLPYSLNDPKFLGVLWGISPYRGYQEKIIQALSLKQFKAFVEEIKALGSPLEGRFNDLILVKEIATANFSLAEKLDRITHILNSYHTTAEKAMPGFRCNSIYSNPYLALLYARDVLNSKITAEAKQQQLEGLVKKLYPIKNFIDERGIFAIGLAELCSNEDMSIVLKSLACYSPVSDRYITTDDAVSSQRMGAEFMKKILESHDRSRISAAFEAYWKIFDYFEVLTPGCLYQLLPFIKTPEILALVLDAMPGDDLTFVPKAMLRLGWECMEKQINNAESDVGALSQFPRERPSLYNYPRTRKQVVICRMVRGEMNNGQPERLQLPFSLEERIKVIKARPCSLALNFSGFIDENPWANLPNEIKTATEMPTDIQNIILDYYLYF